MYSMLLEAPSSNGMVSDDERAECHLSLLLKAYSKTENLLKQATQLRDEGAEKAYYRVTRVNPGLPGYEPTGRRPAGNDLSDIQDRIKNLLSRAAAARSACQKGSAPMIFKLARGLDREEIDIIFEMERQVSRLTARLAELEARILDAPPMTIEDASRKLALISSLMMDHHDIELDYFAFLIAECSEVIELQSRRQDQMVY